MGLFPVSQSAPLWPPGTPPRPGTFCHGPPCGCGEPLRGGNRPRSRRQTPHHGQVSPGLPSLTFLEFYSFPFFEIFFLCVYFLLFFKIRRKKIPSKWAFYKKYESHFSCPALEGWGDQAPLQGPWPSLVPHSVFRVASVALCLRLTMLHCLHAPEVDVSGAWSSCAAACLPDGIAIKARTWRGGGAHSPVLRGPFPAFFLTTARVTH